LDNYADIGGWKTYTTLTDLESVFKSLKSELGLRPIFHQTQSRVDGHLFITLLAYSIIHTIRYKLKQKGIHYSWNTIDALGIKYSAGGFRQAQIN